MTLSVNTGDLRSFAANLESLASTTGFGSTICLSKDARTHTEEFVRLDASKTGPMYTSVMDKTSAMREDVVSLLQQLGAALSGSAVEIGRTADEYDSDDDEAAAELDAAFPVEDSPHVARWGQAVYTTTPSSVLDVQGPTAPSEAREFEDYVAEILTTDWLSPSAAVNQLIDFFFDYDPVEEVVKNFSGNWNSMYLCASALDNLGAYFKGMSLMIPQSASMGINNWTGNVADAALGYFSRLGEQCAPWMDAVQAPGNSYRVVADSMKIWAEALGSAMTTIMDALLFAIVCAAGGTALIETVIGAIIGYLAMFGGLGVVAFNVYRVTEVITEAYDAIIALGAVIGTATQLMVPGEITFTPPTAYDNTLVD